MTYAVTLALLLEYAVQKRQWLRPAVYLGSNMVCTAALGWALGLLYGTASWYVIAPGLQGKTFDALCTPYDENYPLRLADYTDALWNRGVLDSTKKTVCFMDSPFARAKLDGAAYLCAGGREYPILAVDDHDAGWLMVTLEIDDATILWDEELTTK